MNVPLFDVVIPTVGRASLSHLLAALATELPDSAGRVVVVDDRRLVNGALPTRDLPVPLTVLKTHGRGPARARNVGWRASAAPWVVFLDDDVRPRPGWGRALEHDLLDVPNAVGGVQGQIVVPLPGTPTDWERNVGGLVDAAWATADMAYRRTALLTTGGFDERFPRAYREDADLALRVIKRGYALRTGTRVVEHPAQSAPWWISLAKQAGNLDDALMRRLHGRHWRARARAPRGRLPIHAATTLALGLAVAAARRAPRVAIAAIVLWCASTAQFAARRVAGGPRTRREIAAMLATSVLIPPAATGYRLRGELRARREGPRSKRGDGIDAVVVDRDGTIVIDVPYNGDPELVTPVPGAKAALARLRAHGLPVVIATNQSGVARGMITPAAVDEVNARVEELLGPFEAVLVCPHGDADNCDCRKPAPGLVQSAADATGTEPARCVVIGDCAADIDAAEAAGARAILVPNDRTRPEEVVAAPLVAADLTTAVDYVVAMATP